MMRNENCFIMSAALLTFYIRDFIPSVKKMKVSALAYIQEEDDNKTVN